MKKKTSKFVLALMSIVFLRTVDAIASSAEADGLLTFSGLIETEMSIGNDFNGDNFSEFNIATVELGLEAKLYESLAGHILVKYEGEEDDIFLDEAYIQLGPNEKYPFILSAGKGYMPFGNFETNMIQDPLTLEIGEVSDTGLTLSYEKNGIYGIVFGYNGLKESGEDELINGFGLAAGFSYETDDKSLEIGVSWINNLADSSTITDALAEKGFDTVNNQVNGLSGHILTTIGSFTLIGEYLTALDDFGSTEIVLGSDGAKPQTWNTELSYSTNLFAKEAVFALGYQKTDGAVELGLPESRIICLASFSILDGTTIGFEYFQDEDYSQKNGGTGNKSETFTLQLSNEF